MQDTPSNRFKLILLQVISHISSIFMAYWDPLFMKESIMIIIAYFFVR